jgi:hypothetical protein
MDEKTETVEVTVDNKLPLKHELGQLFVGGIAAFAADKLASAAYVKVLNAVRARKAR